MAGREWTCIFEEGLATGGFSTVLTFGAVTGGTAMTLGDVFFDVGVAGVDATAVAVAVAAAVTGAGAGAGAGATIAVAVALAVAGVDAAAIWSNAAIARHWDWMKSAVAFFPAFCHATLKPQRNSWAWNGWPRSGRPNFCS